MTDRMPNTKSMIPKTQRDNNHQLSTRYRSGRNIFETKKKKKREKS